MRALLRHPVLIAWVASQVVLGAWISREPLTEAALAIRSVAPLVAQYATLKAEGKL